MFDIAFSELMILALVALVVIGPQRLPKVAKQAGEWLGKLQRYVNDVKSDINRQMELEELRNLQKEVKEAASSVESSLRGSVDEAQAQFDSIATSFDDGRAAPEQPRTDWDQVYQIRRTRERIKDRRRERDRELGRRRPRR
ncbi:MAG: twin-arginine translocase subunit TatB [Burkholderiales bacterium]|nr:MAG: twin-arginine translocase subunit TatB [Burkholderiales bacterium]